MSDLVLMNQKDAFIELVFNRPKALNALNREVLETLKNRLEEIQKDNSVRVILLKGAGDKAFVAGADIKEMSDLTPLQARDLALLGQGVADLLEAMPQITIACVDGFALGGGCEIAMACDMIYASDKAKFGQPEVNLGLIAGFGGTQRLPRAIGYRKAKELLFTGKMIDANEAKSLGLVCDVFNSNSFDDSISKIVKSLLSKGPKALIQTKRVMNMGRSMRLSEACALEREFFAMSFNTPEQKEGMSAFLEKRKADFKVKENT